MKLRPLRVNLRLLRIVAHYETSSVTSWVEAVTNCRPLWNFVRYELSWGCYELLPTMKLRPLRVELRLLRIVARYETLSVKSWVENVTKGRPLWNFVRYELSWGCYELLPAMKLRPLLVELRLLRIVANYETSTVTSWVEAVTNCRPLWNFVRYELSWGCYELLPTMKLRPLRVELRLLRIVANYETSTVTSWVEAVTNCRPLWNFVRYELSWGCYELLPTMKLRPLRVELRLLRIVARYEILSVTSWVENVTKCRPLWNFVRYELSWGCYELLPAMKLRPLRIELRLLKIVANYETSSVTSWVEAVTNFCPLWNFFRYELSWGCYELLPTMKLRPLRVELRLLRIVARYETLSVTSWVENVTKGRPLWNFVRYELSWGCYELLPAMKLRPLRVELRLLRIVANYETSTVTSWVEAVTNCRPLWNFVRYELSWGCYQLLPAMKLRTLRIELRLLKIVANYETSSVTSWVEAVTNFCPLWNFVRYELSWGCYELLPTMKLRPLRVELRLLRIVARYETLSVTSWFEAVTNCCPLWNFVLYELSWGCYELLPTMKLRPLRIELRLLRIVARYETSSVTSWVEAVTNCWPLWNVVRYELNWGCYEVLPTMKFRTLRIELRLLRIVANYETSSVTSWVEAVTNCCPLWNFVRYELSWGCYELLPTMNFCWLRIELRLLRIVANYENSSVTKWVEAVTNCCPLWNFVRYELSWGCYELLPTMNFCPLRVELRLLRNVARYETSSVTSWVEAVTNCRPLWKIVRYELSWGWYELLPTIKFRPLRVELRLLRIDARYETLSVTSWVEAVTNCRPLWNFVCYELSWGCYELLPAMKLRPLRVALRLLQFFARYETSSVWVELKLLRIVARYGTSYITSWVEAVTKDRPLWNFVRYELSWGCYELLPAMKLRPLRVELRLLRIVARYEKSSVTSWVEADTNCCPL